MIMVILFAGIVACNWLVIFSVCVTLSCTFDPTGRTFVKLKATRRRQRNLTTYTLRYYIYFCLSFCLNATLRSTHIHKFGLDSVFFCLFSQLGTGWRKVKPAAGAGDSSSSCAAQEPRTHNPWVTTHTRALPLSGQSETQRNESINMSGTVSSEPVIKIILDRMSHCCDTKKSSLLSYLPEMF